MCERSERESTPPGEPEPLTERDGRLVIDAEDLSLTAEELRELRLADQR